MVAASGTPATGGGSRACIAARSVARAIGSGNKRSESGDGIGAWRIASVTIARAGRAASSAPMSLSSPARSTTTSGSSAAMVLAALCATTGSASHGSVGPSCDAAHAGNES